MEENKPEAASGGISAPQNAERAAFAASPREVLAAVVTYALAYAYIRLWPSVGRTEWNVLLTAFTLGFIALTEYLHENEPRAWESWVWLGCAAANLCAIVLGRGRVWGDSAFWFLHIFAVWWALSRSNTLLEGESGHLLPLDALDGFAVFPFKHFLLRARTVGRTLSRLRGGERKKAKPETILWTLGALAAALVLLVTAVRLLMRADAGFDALLAGVADFFTIEWDADLSDFLFRFLLSLPVGAYLYGLIAGTGREDRAALDKRGEGVRQWLETLRKVPGKVWTPLTALFCALYALFFVVQARYLFGAFTRTLPDGFVVSEYARQGFFELCKVMAVNFALLWLVTRSSKENARAEKTTKALCLALLAESFLLAVVAFSKLWLYIENFGFTPKRLQSTWLVCVLAFGCGCAAWSLARGEKTFRVWMIFGAVTLSLLCLY